MHVSYPRGSRTQRRSCNNRAQRLHSFSRCWSRAFAAGAVLSLAHPAQAAPTATYDGTDGNYSTPGNFTSGGSPVVPDGSNGIFYAVSISGADVTHDHSTGTDGVDTIASLTTDSNFYLSGGILAGSGANRSSLFAMSPGKLFQLSGGATLRNFTVTGAPITMNGSGTLDNVTTGLTGTVFGTLTFANNTLATVSGDDALNLGNYNDGVAETLTGAGTLALGDASGTGTLNVGQYDAGVIGTGTVVSGQGLGGTINGDNGASSLTNSGTIQADGGTLTVQGLTASGGFVNNATLQAINGGTLNLDNSLTNLGLFTAGAGSTINLNGVTLTGNNGGSTTGLLSTTGTGLVNSNQSALTNVTTGAGTAIDVIGGRSNAFGTLTNGGTITVAAGDTLGLGSYNEGTITLAGAGAVALTGGTLAVGQYDAGVITAGQTVSGYGTINGDNGASSLTNGGTIAAKGGTLVVQGLGGGFTNNSLIESINSGTFNLNSNISGNLSVDSTSTFNFNGVNVSNGTLSGSGVFTLFNASLSNETISAGLDLTSRDNSNPPNPIGNGTFYGTNTLTGGSQITVGGGNALGLGSYNEGTETLTGAGTLVLGNANGTGTLNVGQYDDAAIGAGVTVTTGTGRTGVINGDNGSSSLTNGGTIQANGMGGTLTVQNLGGFTNAKTLQALTGGTLNLDSSLTNTGLLTAANGSTVNLNAITLTGTDGTTTGLLSTTGTGLVNSNQSALTNVTTGAGTAIDVIGGRSNAFGTLTNGGTVTVAAGDTLGLGSYNEGTITLAGAGAVALTGGTLAVGQYDAGVITAGQSVTATGSNASVINGDNGASSLTNSGTIQADGGTLTVQGLGGFTSSEGHFAAANGGTLNVNQGLTSGSTGTVAADATSTVNLNNSLAQDQGTSQVDGIVNLGGGNTLTVTGGTLKGAGTVNGNVVNTSGTVKPGDSPGTLTVAGDYSQASTGHMLIEFTNTAHGLLTITGGVTLGGVLDISYLGPPKANGSYQINPGDPGSTFDLLTYGTLSNTNLGTLFSNEYTSSGSFFVNGIGADNFNGNPAVYQLTQDGNNALQLTLTTTATPEPSQWAAFGLGILGLAGLGLRARRRTTASH